GRNRGGFGRSRLKKKPSAEGSPNRLWALSRYWETADHRWDSEPAVSDAICRYWSAIRWTPSILTPIPTPLTTRGSWMTALRTYPGVLTLAMLSETARSEACAACRPDAAV